MNGKKVKFKVLTVFLVMLGAIILSIFLKDTSVSTENQLNVPNEISMEENITELVIPTRESILKNGYPVNENGHTYGPNLENMREEPDLLLAQGENGVVGYIYQIKSISSPGELAAISSRESTPLYLQDGKTIIGTFSLK